MRKIITYILLAFIVAGCAESTFDVTRAPSLKRRYLNISTSTLNFSSATSTKSVNIESDDTPWKVDVPVSWIKVSSLAGDSSAKIEFTAELNNSADTSRACVAEISSDVYDWNRLFPVTITQDKAAAYVRFESTSLTIDSKEQTHSVNISCNTDFSLVNNVEGWIHVISLSTSGISIQIDENNTANERTGIILLKGKSYPNVSSSLTVRQKKANITSSLETLQFGHNPVTQNVSIESGASWKATASPWLTVTPSAGYAGSTTVSITAAKNASANDREGSVYFTVAGVNSIELPVKQEGVKLSVSKPSLSFDSFGNSQVLEIMSNDEWTISEKPEWVTLSNTDSSGNNSVTVTVSENISTLARQGEIIVSTKNDIVSKRVEINQEGKFVDCADASLYFGYFAGTQSITFTTDAPWTVTVDQDWIIVDKYSGVGSTSLNISVGENFTDETRLGIVTILIADETYILSVKQECKTIVLNSSAFTFDASAASSILSISSNTQWNANVTQGGEWLTISSTSGSNNADITISVKENNTSSARFGKIVVELPGIRSYLINITQNRKNISTDVSSINFGASGGQISFTAKADGIYEVSKIGNWLGFIRSDDIITVIAQENNTALERTGAIKLSLLGLDGILSILIPVTQVANRQ